MIKENTVEEIIQKIFQKIVEIWECNNGNLSGFWSTRIEEGNL
jgi:hypothetical protein